MSVIRGLLIGVALLLPPAANGADALGRLFFSPEQRVQLDTLRIKKVVSSQTKDEPPPEFVTYSGIVRRNDGRTTVWVNNKALSEKDVRETTSLVGRVERDGRILVQPGQGSAASALRLKVGQSAELLSGQVAEGFKGSASKPVPPAKPATPTIPESVTPEKSADIAPRGTESSPVTQAPR